MDVGLFLRERMSFIRRFYEAASLPFIEIKHKVEAHEEPFAATCSEDDEPTFLSEWIEASESLQVLGNACISMLAAALHIYLKTWESELGTPASTAFTADFKKKGWLYGYRSYFLVNFGIDLWTRRIIP